MRQHLPNAIYGVLDYVAYPLGMLVAAPLLLKHLGVEQYGVWIVAMAAVSTGGIVASGFGDANIHYVATARGEGDRKAVSNAVRNTMGIHLVLGGALALISWLGARSAAEHLVPRGQLSLACIWSLRIAGFLMLMRAIESVCISTQRAFERYGPAVRVSIVARMLTLLVSVFLTLRGLGIVPIMIANAVLMTAGTCVQLIRLKLELGHESLLPKFDRRSIRVLGAFGAFSWIQAVAGVIFSQADRLVLGVSLGASAVTAYALCVQIAQPIYGVTSAGLHFLFPYLSARKTMTLVSLRNTLLKCFTLNLLFVSGAAALVLIFGVPLLRTWMGGDIADNAAPLVVPVVWSFVLLGVSVTGYYALMALGRIRTVTWLSVAGGVAMLLGMACLIPSVGVRGAALARLVYGAMALLMYAPLLRFLSNDEVGFQNGSLLGPVGEDA